MKIGKKDSSGITSREKAETLLRAALSKKAFDPALIRLDRFTSYTDFFLIVSARSARQVTAVAEAVLKDARERKIERYSHEGVSQGNWALLDYGDVIVHVFLESTRDFYDLEGLWAEAPRERFSDSLQQEITAAREPEEEADDDYGVEL
jgi:ribosome-associated protein